MGYETIFSLSISGNNKDKSQVNAYLKKPDNPKFHGLLNLETIEGFIVESYNKTCIAKWYDWESDMRKFSTLFPKVVFNLHGLGEDSEDMWIAHFRNGKMHLCKAVITYPEFDAKKLR